MECNGMKQSGTGCRCTMRRERERERETFPWRFVGGGGGLAFMVAFLSFLFGSERCDTIGRVRARSRE